MSTASLEADGMILGFFSDQKINMLHPWEMGRPGSELGS